MTDFKDHFKRAVADETVRWIRWGILGVLMIAALGGVTFFFGGAIKHMVMAPFTKAHEIGIHAKEVVKDKAVVVRDKAGDMKDDLADRYDSTKDKVGEKIDSVKERAPAVIDRVKDHANDAVDKAREVGGNLKQHIPFLHKKDTPRDEVVE